MSRGRVLDRLFAASEGIGERAARNREEVKQAVLRIFRGEGAAGDTRGTAPRSKWCAANAIAEYARLRPTLHAAHEPGAAELRGHAA